MGSLFTSVCPSLVLRGIGETIASRSIPKVTILSHLVRLRCFTCLIAVLCWSLLSLFHCSISLSTLLPKPD
ncbi:hypothetical protein ACQJBY_022645 [Aegilops geniculata]